MLNFLESKFLPKVHSSTPFSDNYEVTNLISDKYTDKIRGFIAYPSIRPPVEIEFEFICSVNIHYIVLNTTVGTQKCSGIEIFAKTESLGYTSIGKCVYDKSGVVFCNSRKYSKSNPPSNIDESYELAFFKSNTFKHFLNATSIKVLIFRTERSVPCIAFAEIWGTPSKSCSKTTVETITRLSNKNNLTECSKTTQNEEFKIPEDYKDDLTYELMTIPMTLPSGKTVDQSTLEKHIESEKSFGRKPCDPFTGIKFSETLKPIINVGLKSRIDMFILQNSDRTEFLNIKRILGGTVNSQPTSSSITNSKRKFESDNSDLDEVIARVKQSGSFINFTNQVNEVQCSSCNSKIQSLYKLPCVHFYCRSCLLEVCEKLQCSICNQVFIKKDVKKVNLYCK